MSATAARATVVSSTSVRPSPTDSMPSRLSKQTAAFGMPFSVQEAFPSLGQPPSAHTHSSLESRRGHNFGRLRVHSDAKVAVPNSVRAVLNSTGQSLPDQHRLDFVQQGLPEKELTAIRLHTDAQAARSAKLFGARAYQAGHHLVFGDGSYRPGTCRGDALLRHEVAHVIQTGGRIPTRLEIASQSSSSEQQATSFANWLGGRTALTSQPAAFHLMRDPALDGALDRIRVIPVPFTPQSKAQQIRDILVGIDLTDPDNLTPVIATIESTFANQERGAILSTLLATVDATAPVRPLPQQAPSPEEEARMRSALRLMQVGPRGPYGQVGPGIVLPVLSQPARHLLPLIEGAGNAFAGAGAFVQGLLIGLGDSMSEADRERLAQRLLQSSILNAVFPFVFAAGAVVGIVEDVIDAVKGIYRLITDFSQFVEDMTSLVRTLIGPDATAVGRAMGEQTGRDYGTRIASLARGNIFEFSYGLGRMIGPTIVYTVLGFLGVPELIASAVISRLMTILRPLLQRFPRLLAIAERITLRLARQTTHTSAAELEADLERSFGHTFTEPAPPGRPGGPTLQPPEVSAGFAARHLAGFRRLLGRPITHPDLADIARVWNSVANPGEAATLTLQNSRRLFDNHRNRFWRAVRGDAAARRAFEDAGCAFEGAVTTAPFYRLPDGSRFQMTIDHIIERQTAAGRALDPANLQIVSRRENTVLLRQLHAQDPFLR